jgi:hypothetical protein
LGFGAQPPIPNPQSPFSNFIKIDLDRFYTPENNFIYIFLNLFNLKFK